MNEPVTASLPSANDDSYLEVPAIVGRMLKDSRFGSRRIERRTSPRFDYPHLVFLTPLDAQHRPAFEETLVALGKRISAQGIDFIHTLPLPFRRAIVSLKSQNETWTGFYTVLKWCRFTESGWYDNGGLFTTVVNSPMDLVNELRLAQLEEEAIAIKEKIRVSDMNSQFFADSAES